MKYLKFSMLLFLACSTLGLAQQKRKSFTHDAHGNPIIYRVSSLSARIGVGLKVDTFTKSIAPFNHPSNQPLTNLVYLAGTKVIHLTAQVPKDSLSFYRYSIIENDTLPLLTNAIPAKVDFVYPSRISPSGIGEVNLGSYNVANKKLKLEIYKITESSKISTVIIYNKPILPAELFLVSRHKKLINGGYGVDMKNLPQGIAINLADDLKGLLFSMRNTDINFIYHVFLKDIGSGKTIPLANNWLYDFVAGHPYMLIDAGYFRDSGDYEIVVVPVLSSGQQKKQLTQQATTFRFSIQKETTFTKKEITFLLGAFILASGIMIGFLRVRSNKKLAKEKQEKEISQLQLNLVRAQLNPHFMFNALAGIQNLMNKNDTENANRYLGKFARLTRNVLKNQERIPLEEEIALLEDYLQMEKLRFGFHYTISVDAAIAIANVEIPAMLLQPFVENAVKHGVSGIPGKGEITICFEKNNQDLIMLISDDGSGFELEAPHPGLGLSLSRSRLALLNKIYKNTPILLHITSGPTGTEVKISLKHWL